MVILVQSNFHVLCFGLRIVEIQVITGVSNSKLTSFWIYCNIFWFLKLAEYIGSPCLFFQKIKNCIKQHSKTRYAILKNLISSKLCSMRNTWLPSLMVLPMSRENWPEIASITWTLLFPASAITNWLFFEMAVGD